MSKHDKRKMYVPPKLFEQAQKKAAFKCKFRDKPGAKQTSWQDIIRAWLKIGAKLNPDAKLNADATDTPPSLKT